MNICGKINNFCQLSTLNLLFKFNCNVLCATNPKIYLLLILDWPSRMKKVYYFQKKDEPKRTFSLAKPITNSKTFIPSKYPPDTLKYYVGAGNNSHLIRKIMSTRKNWEQITDSKSMLISFKWQQSNKGYQYQNCSSKRFFKLALNHFQYHHQLSNKEHLFRNLLDYCQSIKLDAFQFIPLTFILNLMDSSFDSQQMQFLNFYRQFYPLKSEMKLKVTNSLNLRLKPLINSSQSIQKKSKTVTSKYVIKQPYTTPQTQYLWILKPTSYNRGNGVHVFSSITELESLMNKYISGSIAGQEGLTIKNTETNGKKTSFREVTSGLVVQSSSFVVQKYMQRPLLYEGRKFDIRVWVLITQQMKVYFFRQGYLRTSSVCYQLSLDKVTDLNIHLTNNAVQKHTANYNKFQKGNQLSFKSLKTLLQKKGKDFDKFIGRMKEIITFSIFSVKKKLNRFERQNCFQIFGYDFMVDDSECRPWLIQVNTNPCIEQSSPLLEQLIPRMLDDAFKLTIDRIFQSERGMYNYVVQNEQNNQNLWDLLIDLKKA